MARRDLSKKDASLQEASELDYIIRKQKRVTDPVVKSVTGIEAIKGKKVLKTTSTRDVTRVLFISGNSDLLNPTQQSLDGYLNISDLFDEVHILILRQGIAPKNPILRVAKNVWLYTASSQLWWLTPFAGIKMVEEQLEFASGFRPDLIVARDPFESAIVAYKLAEKYQRPVQLHVMDDYNTSGFIKKNRRKLLRLLLPAFTIPKFESVRTLSNKVEKTLRNKYVINDLSVLPRYQNYEALINIKSDLDLKEKYKPFIFFILFVGKLDHTSSLPHVIDSIQAVLKNPRVGLIVIGDGPSKGEFEKKTKVLGIENQVIFETRVSDEVPYLSSANILLVGDTTPESEELVLRGAAIGIPMVMAKTQKREDVFTNGESAFLTDPTSEDFGYRVNDLLNHIGLRKEFTMNSPEIIREKFHNDPNEYLLAYRNSIEQAFFIEPNIPDIEDV